MFVSYVLTVCVLIFPSITQACLVHFSPRLRCGVANCPIGDWNSFLKNTAKFRQAHRRREYGDESDPKISEFLKKISPLNHTEKITVPLFTSHGENDTRVPVDEAIKMWDLVKRNGVHTELVVAEKEGHGESRSSLCEVTLSKHHTLGFKQKVVMEYCNSARVAFLKRWLVDS
jgi:dipeptidyl aminopeptidase/acylaminoacyl peptidase